MKKTYILTLAPSGGAASIRASDGDYVDLCGDVVLGFVHADSEEDALRQSLDLLPEAAIESEWADDPACSGVEAFELA